MFVVSNIKIYNLPKTNEQNLNIILQQFQNDHYTDHQSIWRILDSMTTQLGMGTSYEMQPLFWGDDKSFSQFLYLNKTQHLIIYSNINKIAETLISKGYGKNPIIFSLKLNPVMNFSKYDGSVINQFINFEYSIHQQLFRGLNILLDTLGNQPIPVVGGL